jgi:nicotinamide-nucleotide amidase
MKNVTVLSTGNELLYGTTPDTNSSFISDKLFPLDLRVRRHIAVGDDIGDLEEAFRYALDCSDMVIATGGLGPTDDDNTIAALQKIFGFSVTVDIQARLKMDTIFNSMGMKVSEADLKMVEIPSGARILPNARGLAPGFILENAGKIIIAMPGVPAEMADMMENGVIPFLRQECRIQLRKNVFIKVILMKESEINTFIKNMDIGVEMPDWGITAKQGIATVTFVQKGGSSFDAERIVSDAKRLFGARLLDPSFMLPEEEVIHLLRSRGMTVATAESCTGGLISKRITDIPGASDVFTGSIVAYGNATKVEALDVASETLSRFGAVSEETAAEMAAGVRRRLGADIGISTSGIAGPGGGTDLKPVGTVCFSLADKNGSRSFTRNISGDRERIRAFASLIALESLRSYLKGL